MSNITPPKNKTKKLRGRLIDSRIAGKIANFPPIAWIIQTVARIMTRRQIGTQRVEIATIERAAGTGLEATLQSIVHDVVGALGYVGAMVATYEQGDSLPVRAFFIDPDIATVEQIQRWEEQISKIKGEKVSVSDPTIAVAYRYKDDNLSVQAIESGRPIKSRELYDLFKPVAPLSSKPAVAGIQQALGVQEVIAVPFFLQVTGDSNSIKTEVVGNLFAAKRGEISDEDIVTLSAFGRQAAAAIESEQRRIQNEITQQLILSIQANLQSEDQILQKIAEGVVKELKYVGAMVATYEPDDSLPVRAFFIDPGIATVEQIQRWEEQISKIKGEKVSVSDPTIAVAYRYKDDNLSVQAIEAGEPVRSSELYDLFKPVAPPSSIPIVKGIQEVLNIERVIAVPFFRETSMDGQSTKKDVIGNLFAASRSKSFSSGEIHLLEAFGQQAAIGLWNARLLKEIEALYKKSEARREIAQTFAKMAFFANTAVHNLSNAVGGASADLEELRELYGDVDTIINTVANANTDSNELQQLVTGYDQQEIVDLFDDIFAELGKARASITELKDPFRSIPDKPVNINKAIARAARKVAHLGRVNTDGCKKGLPEVVSSIPVLSEVFRIFFKNGLEAMNQDTTKADAISELMVSSTYNLDTQTITIAIKDTGVGIESGFLNKIFDYGTTTKGDKGGLGFGLFWARDTIVEYLKGSINVDSVVGQGTTFYIQLPVSHNSKNSTAQINN